MAWRRKYLKKFGSLYPSYAPKTGEQLPDWFPQRHEKRVWDPSRRLDFSRDVSDRVESLHREQHPILLELEIKRY